MVQKFQTSSFIFTSQYCLLIGLFIIFILKNVIFFNSLLGSWSYHRVLYPLFCPTFSFDAWICIQLKAIAGIPIKRASSQEGAAL